MNFISRNLMDIFSLFIIIMSLAKFSAQQECVLDNIGKKSVKHIDSDDWNDYVHNLFAALSASSIQQLFESKQELIETNDIDYSKPEGWKITQENFKDHLKKIEDELKFQRNKDFGENSPTELQLQTLNYVLEISMVEQMKINNCSEPDLIITGHFINLDEAFDQYYSQCNKETFTDKRSVQIFAYNTLFVNTDVKQKVPLIFIAPKWEIIGETLIDLSGRDAVEYIKDSEVIKRLEQIKKNLKPEDGLPGVPGEPGGFFYGIGEEFIKGENLKIIANGGNGGDGKGDNFWDWCVEKVKDWEGSDSQKKIYWSAHVESIEKDRTVKRFGGRGGAKGLGGPPGNVTLISLNEHSKISIVTKNGENGQDGTGLIKDSDILNGDAIIGCTKYSNGKIVISVDGVEKNNLNINNQDTALNYTGVPLNISSVKITNEYQHYFRENFKISMKEYSKIEFIKKLNRNTTVYNFSFYLMLLDEFSQLEIESYVSDRDIDLLPFYEIFLDKIDSYAKAAEHSELSSLEKTNLIKFLEYLFAVTLSRKSSINENLGTYLISDVPEYLKNLGTEFDKLKILINTNDHTEFNKNVMKNVEAFKDKFLSDIHTKSSAAKDVVEKDLQLEINNITHEFKIEMDKLKKEVNGQINITQEQGEKLKKTREIIKKHFIAEVINNVADTLCSALQLVGPKGAMAAALIQIPTKFITNTLDRENNAQLSTVSGINNSTQKSLQSLKSKLNTMKENKHKKITNMINEIKKVKEKKNLPDNLLTKFISKIETEDGLNIEKVTYNELSKLETELNDKVKAENINIKGSKKNDWKGLTKLLDNIEKISAIPDSLVGVYTAFSNYTRQTDQLDKTILENKILLEYLKDFEKNEYPRLMKKLEDLVTEVNKIRDEVGTKSKVELDFFRFKAIQVFEDTKNILSGNLSDYNMKDRLIYVIGRLEGVLPFLVTTNNVIQDFHEQGNLVQVIADMLKTPYQDDHPLKTKLKQLEERVITNILLKKYKLAYRALEQYVFPFADFYLNDTNAPEKLIPESTIDNFVNRVVEFVSAINNKIKIYDSSINKADSKTETLHFYSYKGVTDPFFVWKNSDYKTSILALLSGNEVFLNADIKKQLPPLFDAIKFNEVTLYFKVNTTERHGKFQELLSHFKIILTHFGNNFYTFNEKIYSTNTKPVEISYYFKCYEAARPCASESWRKLKDNPGMMSPYALWKVQLEPEPRRELKVTFDELKEFADEIDLELEGIGPAIVLDSFTEKSHQYKSMQTCNIPEKMGELSRKKLKNRQR